MDIMTLIELGVLIFGGGIAWGSLKSKQQAISDKIDSSNKETILYVERALTKQSVEYDKKIDKLQNEIDMVKFKIGLDNKEK